GKGRVERLAREAGVHLLFGSPAYGRRAGRREIELRNRAFLLNPEGFEVGEYDKLFLVPFGEYNPLPFVRQIVEAAGNFTPGTDAHVLRFDGRAFGTLICYEGVQPDLPRRFVAKGAGFLVNITNDAWFGKTVAPYQHLVQEAFRAAENKVPMVRAANTGVSAVIGPTGEIVAETGLYAEALLAGEIHPRPGGTFYSRRGNLFAYAAMLYYAGSAVAGYLRRKT
ncbi:MAG: apolipoprotein N-acyltransferase, partial [Candidatus Methylomirabilis sp.]|nr:apolipoprotein N-acyltransferase [Deltaproteobacteria bacterium]